jgi:hypothetical protein
VEPIRHGVHLPQDSRAQKDIAGEMIKAIEKNFKWS